ncbi:hypothetical protein [Bacillus sp. ISL-55]|uniref:hypothetical protein n=1 Tax=Bacillus sp. ISL-55 TaxID=2819134 RepID=UPI001BE7173C|nr:hypothetical protein [Bacillus sp. ISL-55]
MMVWGEKLSEVGSSSDRFGGARGKAVRSRVKFGQVWWRMGKSCQENEGIVTGLMVRGQKLSRKRRNRDRFEVLRPKAVKKMKES